MEYLSEEIEVNLCSVCHKEDTYLNQHCSKCGACPQYQEIRDYSMMWHDGEIHCTRCGNFIRDFDAG